LRDRKAAGKVVAGAGVCMVEGHMSKRHNEDLAHISNGWTWFDVQWILQASLK